MRNTVMVVLLAFFMAMTAAASTVVDFGRVKQGERPERAFEARNESGREWRVRDVIRTCSCADLEVVARRSRRKWRSAAVTASWVSAGRKYM